MNNESLKRHYNNFKRANKFAKEIRTFKKKKNLELKNEI